MGRVGQATRAAAILGSLLLGLSGCESPGPAPVQVIDLGALPPLAPAQVPAPAPAPAAALPQPGSLAAVLRPRARWVAAEWADLPGWTQDRPSAAWPAWLASCARLTGAVAASWRTLCAEARALQAEYGAAPPPDDRLRAWLETRLRPWRVEALDNAQPSGPVPGGGAADGLLTGYFEPLVRARRQPQSPYVVPLHAPPADLSSRQPWWTRAEQAREPAARAALQGRELAYVADPLEALMLQIQGSGRLQLQDEPGPDGQARTVRLAFAGHNGQPYRSIGRWLVEQGELSADGANWPAIRAWARLHPERVDELLNANPRTVFFREEALPSDRPVPGPLGAQGVPLTPGRSIAVDRDSIPLGTPVWLASTEPQAWAPPGTAPLPRPLQRLVLAQDTGGAIVGAVRADFFWGTGEEMETQAGRTRQPLRLWVLWPRG